MTKPVSMQDAIKRTIRQIPRGKVATYGQVAEAAGYARYHRQVAQLLNKSGQALPWHRVLGAGGALKIGREGSLEQRMRLEMEGVRFRGARVDMAKHQHVFKSVFALCGWLFLSALGQHLAWAQPSLNERVLVVYNANEHDSQNVAKYYMMRRRIPPANLCRIDTDSNEAVDEEVFESGVKKPIRKCLEKVGQQKILYIVFSYRTPFMLFYGNDKFSLDQAVADIWDQYSPGHSGRATGNQPYFGEAQSEGNVYQPFISLAAYRDRPGSKLVYSVWRLDAATADIAKALVDKAISAEKTGLTGKGCFDVRYGPLTNTYDAEYGAGDWDVHKAAEFAGEAGFPVQEDDLATEFGTPPSAERCDGAALYAGWYSLAHYNDAFSWNTGAIGFHLDSASALSPRSGPSWAANALLKGITVTSGAVTEPYLEGLLHPDQVFLYLFQGANVGDAVVRGTRWLKWMIINMGDPLYRPFPQGREPFNSPARRVALFALLPQSLVGGATASAVADFMAPAPAGGLTVWLKTDHPELVSLPASVVVKEGERFIRFPIPTQPAGKPTPVHIWMNAGDVSMSNTLAIFPRTAAAR